MQDNTKVSTAVNPHHSLPAGLCLDAALPVAGLDANWNDGDIVGHRTDPRRHRRGPRRDC